MPFGYPFYVIFHICCKSRKSWKTYKNQWYFNDFACPKADFSYKSPIIFSFFSGIVFGFPFSHFFKTLCQKHVILGPLWDPAGSKVAAKICQMALKLWLIQMPWWTWSRFSGTFLSTGTSTGHPRPPKTILYSFCMNFQFIFMLLDPSSTFFEDFGQASASILHRCLVGPPPHKHTHTHITHTHHTHAPHTTHHTTHHTP